MLTLNEEHNLAEMLQNILPWVEEVFIVDSLSTDRTVDIALEYGVKVVQRPFTDFGDQWNWALENLPIKSPWTMKLDPDERFTPTLRDEIIEQLTSEVAYDGISFRRRLWFMGQPLRQYQWVLRIWRTGKCHFSDVLVNEHPIVNGQVHRLTEGCMEHFDSPSMHHWFEKQNVYSTMRAIELAQNTGYAAQPRLGGDYLERRMFYKKVFFKLPLRHWLMWWYLMVVRGGIFSGSVGRAWVAMRVGVYRWAEYKAKEMRQLGEIAQVPRRAHGDFDPRVLESPLQKSVSLERPTPPSHLHPAKRKKQKLRLAINAVSLAPGGGLVVLMGYLRGWQELGMPFDIDVYASRESVVALIEQTHPDVRVIPFAMEKSSARHYAMQRLTLGREMEKNASDVVLSTNLLVGRCTVPQVVLHQNLKRFVTGSFLKQLFTGGLSEAVKDAAARSALRHALVNVFISQYLREEAERVVPASRMRNHVIHNALTSGQIAAAQEPCADEVDLAQIIALQSPSEHKDNPTLFRMLARLVELRPNMPWRLKIAGGGDWGMHQRLIDELGIGGRIEHLGYVAHKQLEPMLRRSLCLVFTSKLEGFGLPPLEGMAGRCATIACNCTAMPEIVGDAGILVPPGDHEAFAQAVLKLAEDPGLREMYVARGVERVRQFSWTDSAKQMADLLERAARFAPQ